MYRLTFGMLVLGAVGLVQTCFGVSVGENILHNDVLTPGRGGAPAEWTRSENKTNDVVQFFEENGTNVVRFLPGERYVGIRQQDIALAEGSSVKVGVWVRTSGLSASAGGAIIHNWSWTLSAGPGIFPADTQGKWMHMEKVVTVPKSSDGRYTFVIYLSGMTKGTVDIALPTLSAVDETAAKGVRQAPKFSELGVVTPIRPLLAEIPEGTSEMLFSFISTVRTGSCKVYTQTEGDVGFACQGTFPLKDDRVCAKLEGMKVGHGRLRAEMFDDEGRRVAESEYPIVVKARQNLAPGKPLNGLVSRLFAGTVTESCTFDMPRAGFVWVSCASKDDAASIYLDDASEPIIAPRPCLRGETLRRLEAGRHTLRLAGVSKAEIIVNRVPTTSTYSLVLPIPAMAGWQDYGGAFQRECLYPVIGVFSCGYGWQAFPKDEMSLFKACGKEYYSQACLPNQRLEDGVGFVKGYLDPARFVGTPIVGRTLDEIEIVSILKKLEWTKGMRWAAESEMPVATWSTGCKFIYSALNAEYLSACCNQGRGRFQFECYPHTSKDEAACEAYLEDLLNDTAVRAKRLLPDALANSWIVFGTYTRLDRGYCYDAQDNVDYKRMADLYFHRLATDKTFKGLDGVGLYSFHSAEEEDLRWVLRLMRHYLLEGKTSLLSDDYGFAYNPGQLTNGSFVKGLEGWETRPAASGSIETKALKGLGTKLGYRAVKDGDNACVFRRTKGQANVLTRTIVNLTPGKTYSLRYAVSTVKDLEAKTAPVVCTYPLEATLEGVTDVTANAPIARLNGARRAVARKNVRFIVFKAKDKSATVTFKDVPATTDAEAAEELVLTAVRVKPYYEGGPNVSEQ